MPSGDALFAWIWLNREHEQFLSCAKVHIGDSLANALSEPLSSDARDWHVAPDMEISYYTVDARCMPIAKP
jgi:hypothetical protein